jgi:hypothetical protein
VFFLLYVFDTIRGGDYSGGTPVNLLENYGRIGRDKGSIE